MFGAHQQHRAAVPLGNDIVLQVFGGVAPAGQALERLLQLLPQAPEPIADTPQGRAGAVEDLAACIDGRTYGSNVVVEAAQWRDEGAEQWKRRAGLLNRGS